MNSSVFSTSFKNNADWETFVYCLLTKVDGSFPVEIQINGMENTFIFSDARSLISCVEAICLARGFKKLIPRKEGFVSAAEVVEEMKREWYLS